MLLDVIPIYRLTLQPESYLPESNPGKKMLDLICELPNTENKHRKNELLFLPSEKHAGYYLSHLLLETKQFCREMLYFCSIDDAPFREVLDGRDLEKLFGLIEEFRLRFFKHLIQNDLKTFKLYKGYLQEEVQNANSVEEIIKHVKKYGVLNKLFEKVNSHYQKLKSIYC